MSSISKKQIYPTLAIVFTIGALTTAAYSIWEQAIAMSAIAALFMFRLFGHKWTTAPLLLGLVVILINQALGVFYTLRFWKVWEANGNLHSSDWYKFGFAVFFLVVCVYAIYITLRKQKSI